MAATDTRRRARTHPAALTFALEKASVLNKGDSLWDTVPQPELGTRERDGDQSPYKRRSALVSSQRCRFARRADCSSCFGPLPPPSQERRPITRALPPAGTPRSPP